MLKRPARIVLDVPEQIELEWCWRDDWVTGWDSIYGLLSKFAKLNAIPASELAKLFVSSTSGRKTAIVRTPDVDLRAVGPFDLVKLSRAFRIDRKQVLKAFVGEVFPNSQRKALPYLKWCLDCIQEGFHSPIHQLEFISACPIHGSRLLSRCPGCKSAIPYRLTREVFSQSFCCSECGFDLSPLIREPQTRSLILPAATVSRLEDVHALIAYEDDALSLAFELDRQRWRDANGRFLLAGADLRRECRDYAGFVSQVVETLRAKSMGQMPLAFDRIEVIRKTSWTRVMARGSGIKRGRTIRSSGSTARWDSQVDSLYRVYSAIRRHLWRHVVGRHRRCCIHAARALWWNMEGEKTAAICPVTEAFIRWRMFWEGEAIPQRLWGVEARLPRGIVAWRDESAPILRFGWSADGEAWLTEHVFALAVIGSFFDLAEAAFQHNSDGGFVWSRRVTSGRNGRYWAVTGNDTPPRPLILFQQLRTSVEWHARCMDEAAGRAHLRWHLARLKTIVR